MTTPAPTNGTAAKPSTAIARQQQSLAPFEPENITQAEALAERLSRSTLLPRDLRGNPSNIFLSLLVGRDLGLSAATSITKIHVIEGKPTLSADIAVAVVKKSPVCNFFRMVESTDEVATYLTDRRGEGETRLSYTIAQARKAGLADKDNWKKHTAAMLRARCSLALARLVYPDVIGGIYDPDELGKEVPRDDEEPGSVVVANPGPTVERDATPAAPVDAEFSQVPAEPTPEPTGSPGVFEALMVAIDEAEQERDESALRACISATATSLKAGDITREQYEQIHARKEVAKMNLGLPPPAAKTEASSSASGPPSPAA